MLEDIGSLFDKLQAQYIAALDRQDMTAWAECFDDEASYICMAGENADQGLPIAIMMDDNRARILDRVSYVTKVWANTFEDYKTRHFVQRLSLKSSEQGLLEVESNFLVVYTQASGKSGVLAAGTYRDVVTMRDGRARFRARQAVLDTVTTPRYLVYPI